MIFLKNTKNYKYKTLKINVIKVLVLALLSFLFSSCTSQPKPNIKNVNNLPSWIFDPNQSGSIGAVGECGTHFYGKSMQRKVAIIRAIEELAMQSKIKVDTSINTSTKVINTKVNNKTKTKTYISAKGILVNAYIEEFYYDNKTEILYVWIINI